METIEANYSEEAKMRKAAGKDIRRRPARPAWVQITCALLFILCVVCVAVLLVFLIDHSTNEDWTIVPILCVSVIAASALGCMAVLNYVPDSSYDAGNSGHKSQGTWDEPVFDSKLKVNGNVSGLDAATFAAEPTSKVDDDLLRAVAQEEGSAPQMFPTAQKAVIETAAPVEKPMPTAKIEPEVAASKSDVPVAHEDTSRSKLVDPSQLGPNQDAMKVASEPTPKSEVKITSEPSSKSELKVASEAGAKSEEQSTALGVREEMPASPKEASEQLPESPKPDQLQIEEATEKETDELKMMLGGSLDSAEEDVLRQIVAENIEAEDLENKVLAAEKQEKALVLLEKAIMSRETLSLREAIDSAKDSGLPSNTPKYKEAKSMLGELDAVLAAHTQLVTALNEEAEVGNLKKVVESAREAGVDDELLSTASRRVKKLETQEIARAKLDAAITLREAHGLRNALEEASSAGLHSHAPRVMRAKSTLKEIDALHQLQSAMETADTACLKRAIDLGRAAGVAADRIAAGEARMKELETKLSAAENLKTAAVAREADSLRAAIAQASAAGVPATDVYFAEATCALAEIEAASAASDELEAAIKSDNTERLKSAMDAARACKIPADRITVAEQRLARLSAQAAALQSLSAAIDGKEIDALRAALEAAASAGVSVNHAQVVAAQSALAEADAQAAACAELESACKAGDIELLRGAIEKGQAAGVDAKLISEAETTLKTLEARAVAVAGAAAELDAAVAGVAESVERLRLAIQNATDLDAVPDATLRAAHVALTTEEKRRTIQKELEVASASRNVKMLTAALEAAQWHARGLTTSPQYQEASKILREENLKEEARKELLKILQQDEKDGAELRAAFEKASTAGVGLDEGVMLHAKEALVREEEKIEALAELEAGTEEGRKVDPKDPFGLEKARDRLVAGVAHARELGCTDTNVTVQKASMMRRHLHNMLQDLIGATRVFCRVRPTNSREKKLESPVVVNVVGGMSVEVTDEDGDLHNFEFDAAFGPTSTQEQIFVECKDLVQSVLDGYNITIFAYGQTGAGKTFTMMGVNDPPELKGVCPRTIETLFQAIERESTRYDITVTAFMVEVYCSQVNDLGDEEEDNGRRASRGSRGGGSRQMRNKGIKVRCIDDKVTLEGVCERPISKKEELFDLLEDGNAQKKVTATAMNSGSSRSHTILGINVLLKNKDTGKEHGGKILLVDLAGSERLKKSQVTGAARREAIEINKSLSALGDVISAITLGHRVPYRNHVLTMLMSDSLGGTAKTLMFVNASPALDNADETVMALNFATRAKTITSREAAVVAIQAARRGIVDRRKTREFRMGHAADVVVAAVKFKGGLHS